jgi:hypothetical protein
MGYEGGAVGSVSPPHPLLLCVMCGCKKGRCDNRRCACLASGHACGPKRGCTCVPEHCTNRGTLALTPSPKTNESKLTRYLARVRVRWARESRLASGDPNRSKRRWDSGWVYVYTDPMDVERHALAGESAGRGKHVKEGGPCKIGCTKTDNPRERVRQQGERYKLVALCETPWCRIVEKATHYLFDAARLPRLEAKEVDVTTGKTLAQHTVDGGSEWFDVTPRVAFDGVKATVVLVSALLSPLA